MENELTAGRELEQMTESEINAAIAIKVMGWTEASGESVDYMNRGGAKTKWYYTPEGELRCTFPHYCGYINEAFRVVEKMQGYRFSLMKGWKYPGFPGKWKASFTGGIPRCICMAVAETAPLAICLAALKVTR